MLEIEPIQNCMLARPFAVLSMKTACNLIDSGRSRLFKDGALWIAGLS